MTIKSIEVNNLLSLKAAKLDCNNLTTLVGTNGAGKSNFLRALSVFYSLTDAKSLSSEKWFLGETKDPVEITVEFVDLHKEEKERLAKYVKNETLKITLRAILDKVEEKVTIGYYGKYLQHSDIHIFRNTKFDNTALKKEAYNKLKAKLTDIPNWTNKDAADDALSAWEENHPNKCVDMEDEGKFFGFKEVTNGYLKTYTRFLYLPAVKDASDDAVEGAGSLLSEISEIIKTKIKSSPALKNIEDTFRANYETTLRDESSVELINVNKILSEEIGKFLPDFGVEVDWGTPEVKAQLSKMNARLIEKGMEEFPLPLQQQGHGVQRMYILSILKVVNELRKEQIINQAENTGGEVSALQPDLIIGIEEPELYQHPIQQRKLYKIFREMCQDSGGKRSIQMLYSTHSSNFVDVEDFENLRLVTKSNKKTSVGFIVKDNVIKRLVEASGEDPKPYTIPGLDARLYNTMNSIVNEGFFAKELVLVEGFSDCVFIDWLVDKINKRSDFDKRGIAVIPVFGRNNLAKPIVVFEEIGLKTYFMFDADGSKKDMEDAENTAKTNKMLMKIGGEKPEKFPTTFIGKKFTCFADNMEKEIERRISTEIWNDCLDELKKDYGFNRDVAKKNPIVMRKVYDLANKKKADFTFFEDIIKNILS